MQELHIQHFRVDLQRAQVHDGETVLALEPRVLQVLIFLAQNQGEVVSHQALMEAVWGQSVVEPSTLQRCIGQLRRAFGDDARQQHTIATYPKIGYSLLPEVTWHNRARRNPPAATPSFQKQLGRPAMAAAVALLSLLLVVISWQLLNDAPEVQVPLSEQAVASPPLTMAHTDFYALYSPDGRYVAYSRALDNRLRQLRGRDLSNGREFPLTEKPGDFEGLAWSPDSRQLAFIEQATCSTLKAVTLADVMAETATKPSTPTALITDCDNSALRSPQWIDHSRIALIEGQRIIALDLQSKQRRLLYAPTETQPQQLAWSTVDQQLAVLENNPDNNTVLLLMSHIDSEQPVFNRISLPPEMRGQQLHLVWNPGPSGLLISTATALFSIGLDGSIVRRRPPFLPDSTFPSRR